MIPPAMSARVVSRPGMAIVKTAAASVLRQSIVRHGAMNRPQAAARTSIDGSVCGDAARRKSSRYITRVVAVRVISITDSTASL